MAKCSWLGGTLCINQCVAQGTDIFLYHDVGKSSKCGYMIGSQQFAPIKVAQVSTAC
jgi:hypothetical protein